MVWTLIPILVCPNLQLDLVEDLALGKEWQLGYWKHPPLPWWVADLAYRLTGQVDAVYVLGPLAAVLCFYAVWLLGREIVGPFRALIAVLVLEGVHFYNFSVVKFAHDQMQLAFLGAHGAVLLPGDPARPDVGLGPRRRIPCGCVLVEIRRLSACRDPRSHSAARSGRAAGMAHRRAVSDGAGICLRDRPERLVAR